MEEEGKPTKKNIRLGDFAGPVAETVLPMQGSWVQSLVRELDPHAPTKNSHAATKTWCSQIN